MGQVMWFKKNAFWSALLSSFLLQIANNNVWVYQFYFSKNLDSVGYYVLRIFIFVS